MPVDFSSAAYDAETAFEPEVMTQQQTTNDVNDLAPAKFGLQEDLFSGDSHMGLNGFGGGFGDDMFDNFFESGSAMNLLNKM